ncbi:MAG: hypothetical protein E2O68_03105 [Deltaproteobacteria bacterium]|nr:MAG: hypothetical protein E2O68_03105 [Deltaproteobacteria bacterium]
MNTIYYLLIYSLLFTSLPTMGQSDPNQDKLDQVERNRQKTRDRSDFEKDAKGTELDVFSKCRLEVDRSREKEDRNLKFLQESSTLMTKKVKDQEKKIAELKKKIDVLSKKNVDLGGKSRDTSVIDERMALSKQMEAEQKLLVKYRSEKETTAVKLAEAEKDALDAREVEKLKTSSFKIFELTTQELNSSSIAGQVAETNMRMMALATAAVNHLECRTSSDVVSKAYYVLRAASSVYMTNFLGETMDYEKMAECLTNEGLNPEEVGDEQVALLRKARNLYAEMKLYIEESLRGRKNSLILYQEAYKFGLEEYAAKKARVTEGYALYKQDLKNYNDAKKKAKNVMIAGAALMAAGAAPFMWWMIPIGAALLAWYGFDLLPKRNDARRILNASQKELKLAHDHTYLKCNYRDAKRWNLTAEMDKFEEMIKKEEEAAKEKEEREKTTYHNPRELLKFVSGNFDLMDLLFPPAIAQDTTELRKAVLDAAKFGKDAEYQEDLKGGTVEEYKTVVPSNFKPGTPAGATMVKDYEKRYKDHKKIYDDQLKIVNEWFEKYKIQALKQEELVEKFGDVADGDPYIVCWYEFPWDRFRSWYWYVSDEDNGRSGYNAARARMQVQWDKYGCTTENKKKIADQKAVLDSIWRIIEPQNLMLDIFEAALDKAEIDWLNLLALHEAGLPEGEHDKDEDKTYGRLGASYLKFISMIKAEWQTSALDVKRDNYMMIDYQSDSDVERMLIEHDKFKKVDDNRKAGLSDPYTRMIYLDYAMRMNIKVIEQMNKGYQLAADHLAAFQNLLADAEAKLGLDSTSMPDQIPALKPKTSCAMPDGGGIKADPACSCRQKGNCRKISFPSSVVYSGKKEKSGAIFRDYTNAIMSGDTAGARANSEAMKRGAAKSRKTAQDTKKSINNLQRKSGASVTDFDNLSPGLSSSINDLAHSNATGAIGTDSSLSRSIRRRALKDKMDEKDKDPIGATAPVKRVARAKPKKAKKKGPKMGEGMDLGIDESDLELEGDLEGGLDFGSGGVKKTAKVDKASIKEKRQGVVEDDTRSIWDIVTRRYKRSGYPRLLKKKKR